MNEGLTRGTAYWESQYNNRAAVPEHPQYLARWAERSDAARKGLRCHLDVPYGTHAMEKMDIFPAQGRSRALLMFIHGGYWRALDKKDHSFLAAELVKHGVTLAVPNYALCPAVTIEDIVRQMLQACAWLWRNGGNFGAPHGSLYISGHSAGGHLTAMAMAALWPTFARDLPKKVVSGGLAISGVYDLRDIVRVPSINDDVRMTPAQALKLSPMFLPPATDAPLYLAAGGKELPPFVEQNRAFGEKWKKVLAQDIACPGDHHFSILEKLVDPSSALFGGAMKMMGL
jgi:arylformamidase